MRVPIICISVYVCMCICVHGNDSFLHACYMHVNVHIIYIPARNVVHVTCIKHYTYMHHATCMFHVTCMDFGHFSCMLHACYMTCM